MKKFYVLLYGILLGWLGLASAMAQTQMVNKNTQLFIGPSTILYVNGQYRHLATQDIRNSGTFIITDSLVNRQPGNFLFLSSNADQLPVTGLVRLRGTTLSRIVGNPINFFNLELDNSTELRLDTRIGINGTLTLTQGNLFLNGNDIDFGERGTLTGETNDKRVYGPSGFLIAREPALSSPLNRLGLSMNPTGNFGATTLQRGHEEQDGAGSGSLLRYYKFLPTQAGSLTEVHFSYFDNELNGWDESKFGLYTTTNGGNTWQPKGGTVNTGTNLVTTIPPPPLPMQTNNILTLAERDCQVVPTVDIGDGTVYLCTGESIVLDADNPGKFFAWSTGETTQQITVSTTGKYKVAVTDVNGCVGYDSVQVEIKPFPVPDFSADLVCEGETTTFTNSSTVPNGGLIYSWDYGDALTIADTADTENPTWRYNRAGDYTVRLRVTSDFGCTKAITKTVTVAPLPQPTFTASSTCAGVAVSFQNDTPDLPTGYAHNFSWDFGDGQTATEAQPNHTYAAAGTYTVTLTSTTNAGCVRTFTQDITIYDPVEAAFSFNNACPDQTVTFVQESTLAAGTLSYQWDFGDGTTSTLATPEKIYAAAGSYDVHLNGRAYPDRHDLRPAAGRLYHRLGLCRSTG